MLLENQIREEEKLANEIAKELDQNHEDFRTECAPPPPVNRFQSARLLLSHLGLTSTEVIRQWKRECQFSLEMFLPPFLFLFLNSLEWSRGFGLFPFHFIP